MPPGRCHDDDRAGDGKWDVHGAGGRGTGTATLGCLRRQRASLGEGSPDRRATLRRRICIAIALGEMAANSAAVPGSAGLAVSTGVELGTMLEMGVLGNAVRSEFGDALRNQNKKRARFLWL